MRSWKDRILEDLAESARKVAEKRGFRAVVLSAPNDPQSRSIDMFLWSADKGSLHLKVAVDVSDIDYYGQRDLFGVGALLSSRPLAVAEFEDRIELEDDVVYEKSKLPVVNVRTLDSLLVCNKNLYVIGKKKDFFVRINGNALRRERMKRNISLGELADLLKVSRKSVYEYERGSYDVSIEVAEKLIEALSEEILKPFNIYEEEIPENISLKSKPDNAVEERAIRIVEEMGAKHYHVKKAFIDIIARKGDKKVLMAVEHAKSPTLIEEKLEDLEKFAFMEKTLRVAIIGDRAVSFSAEVETARLDRLKDMLADFFAEEK